LSCTRGRHHLRLHPEDNSRQRQPQKNHLVLLLVLET
jgi:hypothetical protein